MKWEAIASWQYWVLVGVAALADTVLRHWLDDKPLVRGIPFCVVFYLGYWAGTIVEKGQR